MKCSTPLALTLIALPLVLLGCAKNGASNGVGNTGNAGTSVVPTTGGAATGVVGPAIGGAGTAVPSGAGAGSGGSTAKTGGAATGMAGTAATGSGGAAAGAHAGIGGASGTNGGQSGAGASGTSGGAGTGPAGGMDPIIPEMSGECPQFTAGTSTAIVMGIPATVIAGDKKDGTGSLVFYWYGTAGAGDVSFLPQSIKDEITADGGIVFAQNAALNTGGDCSGTGTFGIDDFKISDQVVACAVKNYGINPRRIYATGCSAGGLQTGCMGIMRSNYIAAVAPNSGGITIGYGKLQNPMHAPNAITMNGGAGDNVIVNFGNTSEGYDNYILKYGGFAVNCIHNLGHCGAPESVYASAWQFMKDHPFGVSPEPYASGLPSGFDPVCQVFMMTSMAPIGGF